MPDLGAWAHLSLGITIVSVAISQLCRARGKPEGYRSIWLGLGLIGATELFVSALVAQRVDHVLGPGWSMIANHALGIAGIGFGMNASYVIVERSPAAQARNLILTASALVISIAPWIVSAPTAIPAGEVGRSLYYAATWQSTVHWLAFTVFLTNRVYSHMRISRRRVVMLREEGSLATGLRIMYVSQVVIIVAVADALALQAAWLLGRGPESFALFETIRGALGALAIALLSLGAGWPHLHQQWQRVAARHPRSPARRRLRLLYEHWSWLTTHVPEVSIFPGAITGHPVGAEDLQWQRTRMVTEIYDAYRRLAPYYDVSDHQRALDHVSPSRLSPDRVQAAVEHLCLVYALARYDAGQHAVRARRAFTATSHTAETTATTITGRLHLTRAPDTAAVISAAIREDQPWSLAR